MRIVPNCFQSISSTVRRGGAATRGKLEQPHAAATESPIGIGIRSFELVADLPSRQRLPAQLPPRLDEPEGT